VLGEKGKPVSVRKSQQSWHCSAIVCGNAAGTLLAPTLIYQGVYAKKEYFEGWPEARIVMTPSGYQEMSSYVPWAESFIKDSGGNCILIVDGHSTRFCIEALLLFAEARVTVITLPPPHDAHHAAPRQVLFQVLQGEAAG
jgi:hypothetical protein